MEVKTETLDGDVYQPDIAKEKASVLILKHKLYPVITKHNKTKQACMTQMIRNYDNK
jgi:hypothetical protein